MEIIKEFIKDSIVVVPLGISLSLLLIGIGMVVSPGFKAWLEKED